MKRFFVIFISFIILFSCRQSREGVVNKFLGEIKQYELEKSKKYLMNPELLDSALIKSDNESKQMFIEALFSNMEYKVKNSTTREDGNVVVNVSITNIDVANIFNLVYKDIFRKTFNGEKDINISESLANILKKPNLPKKTILSQFLMEKNGDSYKIILRKENIDDIFGSYFSTLTNMNGV